jgi:hypothetical protein
MYIPNTPALVDAKISQKKQALAWWKDKLSKSRKQSLRNSRALQVRVIEEELQTLRSVRAIRLTRC